MKKQKQNRKRLTVQRVENATAQKINVLMKINYGPLDYEHILVFLKEITVK